MSPKNKSKKRVSKGGRGGSHSKRRSRRSTSQRVISCGRDAGGCEKSGIGPNERAKHGAPEIAAAPPEKKRRKRLRKRVPIGEALRKQGLDEHTIAGTYAEVVGNLKGNRKAGTNEKILVEILKECTRHIEAAQPVGEGGVQVQLVHSVERPARKPTAGVETDEEKNEKTAPQ